MSSVPDKPDADTGMTDINEDRNGTSSHSPLPSISILMSSSVPEVDTENVEFSSSQSNGNCASNNDPSSTNNNATSENTPHVTSQSSLPLVSDSNEVTASERQVNISNIQDSRASSPWLSLSDNTASSINPANELGQPRRISFRTRRNRLGQAVDFEEFLFASLSESNNDTEGDNSSRLLQSNTPDNNGEEREHRESSQGPEQDANSDLLSSSHSQMENLIRNAFRVGSNSFNVLHERLNPALTAMSDLEDPSGVIIGLQELSECLLMTNEEVLDDFLPTEKVLDAIVSIMTSPLYEDNVEICLMACRCLSNLLDAYPSSLNRNSYAKVTKALCEKLFEIQYIDIAELALNSLKKISRLQTNAILENSGLTACLSYLDFFSLPTQRIATITVANTLKTIPRKYFDSVKEAVPLLEGLLNNHDPEIMTNTSKCICGMIESFSFSAEKIEQLVTPKILKQLFSYIDPNVTGSVQVKPYILSAISSVVKVSTKTAISALDDRLTEKIYEILTKRSVSFDDDNSSDIPMTEKNTTSIVQSIMHADKDILSSSLVLLENLFPAVPIHEGEIGSPYKSSIINESEKTFTKEREDALLEIPNISSISKRIISLLIDVYSCTISTKVRRTVLQTIIKIISMLTSEKLEKTVQNLDFSLLLSSILTQDDQAAFIYGALDIAEILLKKLPDLYLVLFFRTGIIDEIRALSKNEEYSKAKRELLEKQHNPERNIDDSNDSESTGVEDSEDNDNDSELDEESENGNDLEEEEEIRTDYNNELEEEEEIVSEVGNDTENEIEDAGASNTSRENSVTNENQASSSATQNPTYKYPSFVKFYTELRPYIHDKSCAMVEEYEKELKTRDIEKEMNKEMNDLKLIGDELTSRKDISGSFKKLADVLDHVSEFELLRSKVLHSLLDVLTNGSQEQVEAAQSSFLCVFLKNGNTKAFELLIERLNDALNRFEQFEVFSTYSDSFSVFMMPSIERHIRIALSPKTDNTSSGSKKPKPLNISIQAIASFRSIDEFYKSRVRAESGASSSSTQVFSQLLVSNAPSSDNTPQGSEPQSRADSITENQSDIEMPDIPSLDTRNVDAILSSFNNSDSSQLELPNAENTVLEPSSNPATSEIDENTTSAPISNPAEGQPFPWHLEFYIDDELIPHETPIFGAIYHNLMNKEKQKAIEKAQAENRPPPKTFSPRLPMQSIWLTPHVVHIKKVTGERSLGTSSLIKESPIDSKLKVPESFASSESVAIVIRLLDTLFELNLNQVEYPNETAGLSYLPTSKFTNSKLTAKLNKQLEEPLVIVGNALPAWVVDGCRSYPFLFPFESRHRFLQSTSFGYLRLVHRLQQEANEGNDRESRNQARVGRQKIRIKRPHMFQSAIKVMNQYGSSPYVLEIEFFEDVGTGLGPTLEFFAFVSKSFTRKKLGMWRDDNTDPSSNFVFTSLGLFPKPRSAQFFETGPGKKVLSIFNALGIFVARAMLDSRILDLNFNPLFFKLVKALKQSGEVSKLSINDVKFVDQHLYKSLTFIQKFAEAKKEYLAKNSNRVDREKLDEIRVDNTAIGDLALDFTYPGDCELRLVSSGECLNVDMLNVEDYIEKVIEYTLGTGIKKQLEEFYSGFSKVFSYEAMYSFSPDELVVMCGQGEENWSYEALAASAQANHGYTHESRVVQDLFQVMSEFDTNERKSFLQFVTGSPNLPIGGFKALKPPFTIVCREPEPPLTPDECLPTVMTCVNYFKLPNYSSKKMLRKRILKAIREGSGSFMLS